ncbi:hypothetical protein COT49_03025, partial [candidate division WWE3 bacterium CG08_land_8_20_14_0_20_40_13]
PLQKLQVAGRIRMDTWTADGDTAVYKNASGDIGLTSSDVRLKKNLTPITNALAIVKSLNAYTYNTVEESDDAKKRLGLVAQDLLPILPEATFKFNVKGSDEEYYGIHYEKLTAVLAQAIKEQEIKIDEVTGEVKSITDTQQTPEISETSEILASQSRDMATFASRLDLVESQLGLLGQLGPLGIGTSASNVAGAEPSVGVGSSAPSLPKLEDIFAISDKDISVDRDLVVYKNFNALGLSTFLDVVITGKITTGLLVIDGLGEKGASLATMAGDMVLQNTVTIDSKGNVMILGQVTTQKINVKGPDVAAASAGKVVIPAGTTSVKVSTTAVTNISLIYATPNAPVVVGAKYSGEKELEIMLNAPALEDTEVNWWVVN